MTFGNIRSFQRNGIQYAVVFGRNGNITPRNESFGCPFCLVTQGSGQISLRFGKRPVHLLNLCPVCRKLTGRNDGILRFYLILLFCRFLFKTFRIRIGRSSGRAGAVIPHHRHAVYIQLVQRQSGSHRTVGTGAAYRQTAHDIVHDIVVMRSHRHFVGCGNLRFVIHQYQAVAAAGLYVKRTGKAVSFRFACAENQRQLARIAVGANRYRTAFRYITVTAVCFNSPVYRVQSHIFPNQGDRVAGEFLHGNTGAYAIPVSFRIGKKFAPGSGDAGKIRYRSGIHRDILPGVHGNAFAQRYDGLSGQAPHVHRSRQVHVGIAGLITVYRIAADIMACICRWT